MPVCDDKEVRSWLAPVLAPVNQFIVVRGGEPAWAGLELARPLRQQDWLELELELDDAIIKPVLTAALEGEDRLGDQRRGQA